MTRSVIVSGARTPIGKLSGALKDFTAMDLGGIAIAAALERAGLTGAQVEYVIMGHVIQAGQGQITARQAAVKGGIPMTVPSTTVNKVCLSGLSSIASADQMIRGGQCDIVVAGGMESMTQAPYLLPKARGGYRYGNAEMLDATYHDALFDAFDKVPMGEGTERANERYSTLTREQQDELAARSHERAAAAMKDGRFDAELVAVPVPTRKGDPIMVTEDEGVRPETTVESLAKLRPAFTKNGTITAGNASQISDGGAAVVVMSEDKARELGAPVLAYIGGYGTVAGPDTSLQEQPANATLQALAREGLTPADLTLVELNEAFAAVGLVSTEKLGIDPAIVNVDGGAISLGHPVGMSGTRITLHLVLELARRGGGIGAAALCGGGGQGDALLLHVPASS